MKTRILALSFVLTLPLLTFACLSEPAAPKPIIDRPQPVTYQAVRANDRPLPAFINADGSTQSGRQLVQGSLVIEPPGRLRLVLSTRQVAENGEPGPAVSDTFHAHVEAADSTLVLSPLDTHPLLLEEISLGHDGSLTLTVDQPLDPSGEAQGTYPVNVLFHYPPTENPSVMGTATDTP
jgi:hypothetical protein